MWSRQIVRLGSTLGLVATLGVVAAPAVHAQDRDHGPRPGVVYAQNDDHHPGPDRNRGPQDRGPDRNDQDRNRAERDDHRDQWDREHDQPPVVVQPPPVYVNPQPDYPPPVVVQPVPVPVPVTPDVQAYVLPPLEALFPADDFAAYPPEVVPVGDNVYALSSSLLFWAPEQAAIPQQVAAQLAQWEPGWSASVLDGPQGYGVYLTIQPNL